MKRHFVKTEVVPVSGAVCGAAADPWPEVDAGEKKTKANQ